MPFRVFILCALCALGVESAAASRPHLWVLTDLSDPRDRRVGGHPQNDPDDIVALASLLLEANRFEIDGIVFSSTNRPHLADATPFIESTFAAAYATDRPGLEKTFGGFPATIPFIRSSITGGAEARRFDPAADYADLSTYPSVQALVDTASDHPVNVLLWGPTTEAAIALQHCLTSGNDTAVANMRFIAHWTKSWIAQGTPAAPFHVANCRDDAAACAFLHDTALADPRVRFIETGSVGQTGIVNGSARYPHWAAFADSRLGQILTTAKFYSGKPDGSDSATFWVLIDGFGPSIDDYAPDGSLDQATEEANRDRFLAAAPAINDDLRARAIAAASGRPFSPAFLAERFTYVYRYLNGRYYVYAGQPAAYHVRDAAGRDLLSGSIERGQRELDLGAVPEGLLSVEVTSGGLTQTFLLPHGGPVADELGRVPHPATR